MDCGMGTFLFLPILPGFSGSVMAIVSLLTFQSWLDVEAALAELTIIPAEMPDSSRLEQVRNRLPAGGSGPPTNDQAKKSGAVTPHDTLWCSASRAKGSTVLALSIGIGGHLAMPPLPHHRAYGSVPRRFGGLSTRQLFHGDQTQTTEARFGEGAMQRFREAQPPRSLWAEDSRTGRPFGDLEPPELAIALTARLPLDQDNATHTPSPPPTPRSQP